MTGVILGMSSLLLSLTALAVSMYTLLYPDKGLRTAFKRLESDTETMWDRVESHLGRISRLRRTQSERPVAGMSVPTQEEQPISPPAGKEELPLRAMSRSRLLAWSRRARAVKTDDGHAR